MPELGPQFNVVQFFEDGSCEYVARDLYAAAAAKLMNQLAQSVGARIGTTVRIIITDGGDCLAAEWRWGEGLVPV